MLWRSEKRALGAALSVNGCRNNWPRDKVVIGILPSLTQQRFHRGDAVCTGKLGALTVFVKYKTRLCQLQATGSETEAYVDGPDRLSNIISQDDLR